MSETTNTAAPAATPAAPPTPTTEAAPPVAAGGPEAPKPGFDMATWQASGGSRTDLPDNMRKFYDHINDEHKKQDAFNAVRELRGMIDQADQRKAPEQNRNEQQTEQPDGVEQQVQARLAQMQNQKSVEKFRGDFESMLKEPIKVGDGHSFAFADKKELETFVNYSRDVLQNGKITPQDLYKLWNFERILADTGEWKARSHEEALRKTAGGPKSEAANTSANTSSDGAKSAGERDSSLTVEEIMKQKFPEIYGNMKSGNVRYG
jgi:hypothetical protein